MGPHEINEPAELVDGLMEILNGLPPGTIDLSYGMAPTNAFREKLASLRMRTGLLLNGFPDVHFPLANQAIRTFSDQVDQLVGLFPGDVRALSQEADRLKTTWHITVRPSIYALELALAISPGVFLPEGSDLFVGKDRYLRDITVEINVAYRNGAYNACSVLLRRLLETLIIKAHTRNHTVAMAQNANGEFHKLTKLVDDVVAGGLFGLTRNAYAAMPALKRIGDWGAHNPNVLVRQTDLDPIKADARLCFEELLGKV